jgi:hypothetical protein
MKKIPTTVSIGTLLCKISEICSSAACERLWKRVASSARCIMQAIV